MKLVDIVQTCTACPSQWDAKTEDGKHVYIRYRWGEFSVCVWEEDQPPEKMYSGCKNYGVYGREIFSKEIGDGLDGYMKTEEMLLIIDEIQYEPAQRRTV